MMHTEKQARKTKCCGPEGCGSIYDHYCIASKCMAWQWLEATYRVAGVEGGQEYNTPMSQPEATEKVERGYCGLAGKEKE